MGLFCAFIGAFLLVSPHHFQTAPYAALLDYAIAWGMLALIAGVSLLAAAVLRPGRALELAAHLLVGGVLIALALSFLKVKALTGFCAYNILGLGTVLAGLLPRRKLPATDGGDLFSLLMGLCALAWGTILLAFPDWLQSDAYRHYLSYLPLFGALLLLAGLLLVYAQLAATTRSRRWAIHLFGGSVLLGFGLLIALPGHAWTGVLLYCGGGFAIALLPWLRRGLAALDTLALRARVSLVLVIATSLALILATAVATGQEERLTEEQVARTQQIEARAIAQNVSDFIEMNGARTATMAAFVGRAPMTTADQADQLPVLRQVYRDVVALRSVASDGRIVAATGAAAVSPQDLQELVRWVRQDPGRVQLRPSRTGGRSLLLLGAPIHGDQGIAGTLVAAFDAEALARRIARQGSYVSLADGRGQAIATADGLPPGNGLPPLPPRWDQRFRAGGTIPRREGVAGFAQAPGISWVVAVERPRADALAGVRRGRDLAFGLLLLVIPLTALAGIYAARRIARPLGDLSQAVDEMTAGNLAAPLGVSSGISEVDRLSAAFVEMRDRLIERTRESARLADELRARAETLAESDRRKDEFLAMLAHELRNPLGAIANASYLLAQLAPPDPQTVKPIAIIRRQIQHLVRMVDDLLDVSRITRGKVELRREPVDLAEVLRNAVETARPLAAAHEQRLQAEIPAGPLPLEGDATRLEQVFSNLLRNALKFTGAGGTIEISAHPNGNREVVVRVRDNGIGIAADLLPRIFDLFAQGEQGLDRSGAGLGIGLTLVRSLVEMHGGRVEARSDGPGQGSEFEVRLPLKTS